MNLPENWILTNFYEAFCVLQRQIKGGYMLLCDEMNFSMKATRWNQSIAVLSVFTSILLQNDLLYNIQQRDQRH